MKPITHLKLEEEIKDEEKNASLEYFTKKIRIVC